MNRKHLQSINKFQIGQLVEHRIFHYRGVIVAADAEFKLPPEWYHRLARQKPAKDQPWYQVLVNAASHLSYVPEINLCMDSSGEMIRHPLLDQYFCEFDTTKYLRKG